MNSFDAAVYACTALAVIMGYRAGLLRSLATIFGYLCAMPLAVLLAPHVAPLVAARALSPAQQWLVVFGLFVAAGMAIGALMRSGIAGIAGEDVRWPDRMAGSALGAVRIALLAMLMVLIFERIVPANRQPEFLAQSQLRPVLLAAAQSGLRTLPPDVAATIDRLKQQRGI